MTDDSKTPEQMAEEYADWLIDKTKIIRDIADVERPALQVGFLAGYQAAKPQWISVEERMPRPGQEVLIVDDQIMRVQAVSSYGKWHPYVNGSSCKPTHWMPLPEAPKGEE